jgi:N,N'-diacetylchitobiose transport system permease protein
MSRRSRRAISNVAGVLISLMFLFPVYWMVRTAFMTRDQFETYDPIFIPSPPTLDNFTTAFNVQYFWNMVLNSFMVAIGTVLLALVVGFLAAVTLARSKFKGRGGFLLLVAVAQMAPFEALLIPTFLFLRDGLPGPASVLPVGYGKVPTLILIYFMFTLPFTIWSLRGFVAGIPADLEEAAMVDGSSRAGAFWRVTFPLLWPGLVATSIFCFITAWNEFLFAYSFMDSQDHYTLPVWLVSFRSSLGTDWGATMAASTLFTLPVLIFFLIVQRRMVGGLATGAVKG